ncbi:MAG: hypothetical protein KC433_23175, partial [Anaerolineales bacterium]|nr:hypothetical protein [Anaerolineales bacterium]
MIQLRSPFNQAEILESWTVGGTAVHDFFAAIETGTFFAAPPGIWSPAENLVHLIKSCSPVIMALNVPKTVLRIRFGWAKDESRTL